MKNIIKTLKIHEKHLQKNHFYYLGFCSFYSNSGHCQIFAYLYWKSSRKILTSTKI